MLTTEALRLDLADVLVGLGTGAKEIVLLPLEGCFGTPVEFLPNAFKLVSGEMPGLRGPILSTGFCIIESNVNPVWCCMRLSGPPILELMYPDCGDVVWNPGGVPTLLPLPLPVTAPAPAASRGL